MAAAVQHKDTPFRVEEATIDDLHAAIRNGRITLVQVVQQYIDRARAYNGPSSMLMTADGRPVETAPVWERATARTRASCGRRAEPQTPCSSPAPALPEVGPWLTSVPRDTARR